MTGHNIVWLVKHAVSYSQRQSPSIESDSGEPRSNSLLCTFKFNNQTNIDTAKEGAVSTTFSQGDKVKKEEEVKYWFWETRDELGWQEFGAQYKLSY